ncbi:MAG: hypothetical protein RRZ84_02290 [Romboutsia sp.]
MFDAIMIGLDISLITYFYNIAINSTEISTRLISCLAMTVEVYFIRRHLKMLRLNYKSKKDK